MIYDRAGRYPGFIEHFHKLLARSQNALRGRWENLWASEQTCVVRLVDRKAVIDGWNREGRRGGVRVLLFDDLAAVDPELRKAFHALRFAAE